MYRKVKGVRDIYGPDIVYWQEVERRFKSIASTFGYQEMILPVMERTALFSRGVGDTTDIVEKEMFSFLDGGESVSLRPEGTASVVRSYIENGLHNPPGIKKYYYFGPMFRRERPQKGRFRQFYQFGVEAFEVDSPLLDAEVIGLLGELCDSVGLRGLSIEVNFLGCSACKPVHRTHLVEFLSSCCEELCEDCTRRLAKNPIRILDCKNAKCRELTSSAPLMLDHLCDLCDGYFQDVQKYLDKFGVTYTINGRMVRGLDYYVKTAFEILTTDLGAASAIAGGGRYDGLVGLLGGNDVGGVGFAIGVDRVVALMQMERELSCPRCDVFVVCFEDVSLDEGLSVLKMFRDRGVSCEIDYSLKKMKNQMKKADKSGALYTVIFGEDEVSRGKVVVKDMSTADQFEVEIQLVVEIVSGLLKSG